MRDELSWNGVQFDRTWTRVVAALDRDQVTILRAQLDPGEAEAIIVASELSAGLLLVGEKRGRRIAIDHGLEVTGVLGVLAEAKVRNLIPDCRTPLDDMIRVAGFWIANDLRARYLRRLGEGT